MAGWRSGGRAVALVVGAVSVLLLVRSSSDRRTLNLDDIPQRQIDQMLRLGASYDDLLANEAPIILPPFQHVTNGKVSFQLQVLRDPERARTVRLEFGDGSETTFSVPKGLNLYKHTVSHRFPVTDATRYIQTVTLVGVAGRDGEPLAFEGSTDVCPRGKPAPTVPATPASGEEEEEDEAPALCEILPS